MTNILALIMSGVLAAAGVALVSIIVGEFILRFPAKVQGRALRLLIRVNLLKCAQSALELEEYPAFCLIASAAVEEALRRKLPNTDEHETIVQLFEKGIERCNLDLDADDISRIKELLETKETAPRDMPKVNKEKASDMLQSTQRFVSKMRNSPPIRFTT